MVEPLLEVKDLRIHFFTDEGVVKAVDGVDLTIERGKTLVPGRGKRLWQERYQPGFSEDYPQSGQNCRRADAVPPPGCRRRERK